MCAETAGDILQSQPCCKHGGNQSNGEAGCLGSQCGGTGGSGVDFDDDISVCFGVMRPLYICAADYLYGIDNFIGFFLQTLLYLLGNGQHGSGAEGITGMHTEGIDMVQEHGKLGESYNIGGHNEKRNIEIINIIIETLQEILPDTDPRKANVSKDLITYVEDRKGHDRRYAIAPDKIKAEIGWEPETMFKDGIKKTIAWYLEHEDWMNNVTSGDYQKYYEDMYQGK